MCIKVQSTRLLVNNLNENTSNWNTLRLVESRCFWLIGSANIYKISCTFLPIQSDWEEMKGKNEWHLAYKTWLLKLNNWLSTSKWLFVCLWYWNSKGLETRALSYHYKKKWPNERFSKMKETWLNSSGALAIGHLTVVDWLLRSCCTWASWTALLGSLCQLLAFHTDCLTSVSP